MRRFMAIVAAAPLISGAFTTLAAQGRGLIELPPRDLRSGFYFTAELAAGREQCKFETAPCAVLDANGDPLPSNGNTWRQAVTSPSWAIRLGGTPAPTLRVGAEFMGWSADNGPTTESTVGLLGNVQLYPSRRAGFYLKGGLGYAWSTEDFNDGAKTTENGFMFNAGAGYDIPLSRGISIAPVVDFYQASYGSKIGEETLTERFVFFGASITFQSGRRR